MKTLFILILSLLQLAAQYPSSATDAKVESFKAFNGIRFEYGIHFPDEFDPSKKYRIIAVLCETHVNDNAWKETTKSLESTELSNTIVIVPKVPIGQEHWGTHPIHHAFNDLLKSVRRTYGNTNEKVHLVGLGDGHEVAFWWTYASSALIGTTSIISGTLWNEDRWDGNWYNKLMDSNIPIYAYERELPNKFDMSRIQFRSFESLNTVIADIQDFRVEN